MMSSGDWLAIPILGGEIPWYSHEGNIRLLFTNEDNE
jgi:hypothetical protein